MLLGLVACGVLLLCPPALAAFPGYNGKLAFAVVFRADLWPDTQGNGIATVDGHTNPLRDDVTRLWDVHDKGTIDRVSWSPDGSTLAFTASASIYTIEADGTGLTRLTPEGATSDSAPAFSPDGSRIVFAHADQALELWLMNRDGSQRKRLVQLTGSSYDDWPNWSPDGKLIAFESDGVIKVINADGTGLRTVTPPGMRAYRPDFSPDGKRIAFNGARVSAAVSPRGRAA